jgi:hypothetical protein
MKRESLASRMVLCRACLVLRGPFYDDFNRCERVQRCGCEPKEDLWNAHDYNLHAELCSCCAASAVRSGSKWSLFFCERCKKQIVALNQSVGCALIPIGRHSIMNNFALTAGAKRKDVDEFVGRMVRLGDQMGKLCRYSHARVAGIAESIPEPDGAVPIDAYLRHATKWNAKRPDAFDELVRAMTSCCAISS